MNHAPPSADSDDRDSTSSPSRSLANPRRTRLGADGRPVQGPLGTSGSE